MLKNRLVSPIFRVYIPVLDSIGDNYAKSMFLYLFYKYYSHLCKIRLKIDFHNYEETYIKNYWYIESIKSIQRELLSLKLNYKASSNIDVYFSEKKYMEPVSDQEQNLKFFCNCWIVLEYTTKNNEILLPPKFDDTILEKLWVMDEKRGIKASFEELNFDIFDFEYLKKIQKNQPWPYSLHEYELHVWEPWFWL